VLVKLEWVHGVYPVEQQIRAVFLYLPKDFTLGHFLQRKQIYERIQPNEYDFKKLIFTFLKSERIRVYIIKQKEGRDINVEK